MRTNIEIDEKLLRQAMEASRTATKKAAVEAALVLAVRLRKQEEIRNLFGKIQWDGDLDSMRQDRALEWKSERPGQAEIGEAEELGQRERRSDSDRVHLLKRIPADA